MSPRARKSMGARFAVSLAVGVGGLAASAQVSAAFVVNGTGSAPSVAQSVPQAAAPLATAVGNNVTISWSATTLSGGTLASKYSVRRYDLANVLQATLTDCATGGALSCVESAVPAGTYRYTVQAGLEGWHGSESTVSADVVVSPQTLTITSNPTITTLPSLVTGTLSNFVVGEAVTYRLE